MNLKTRNANIKFFESRPDIRELLVTPYEKALENDFYEKAEYHCTNEGCDNTHFRARNVWIRNSGTECRYCIRKREGLAKTLEVNTKFFEDNPELRERLAEDYEDVLLRTAHERTLYHCARTDCSNTYWRTRITWRSTKEAECESCVYKRKGLKRTIESNIKFFEENPELRELLAEVYEEVLLKKRKDKVKYHCANRNCSNIYLRRKNDWLSSNPPSKKCIECRKHGR